MKISCMCTFKFCPRQGESKNLHASFCQRWKYEEKTYSYAFFTIYIAASSDFDQKRLLLPILLSLNYRYHTVTQSQRIYVHLH